MAQQRGGRARGRRKPRKNIPFGQAHIKTSFNNTIVTITDMNGEVLAWNVDRAFGDVLDALLLVDLRRSDPRLLRRYMGADGAAAFLALHAPPAAA